MRNEWGSPPPLHLPICRSISETPAAFPETYLTLPQGYYYPRRFDGWLASIASQRRRAGRNLPNQQNSTSISVFRYWLVHTVHT